MLIFFKNHLVFENIMINQWNYQKKIFQIKILAWSLKPNLLLSENNFTKDDFVKNLNLNYKKAKNKNDLLCKCFGENNNKETVCQIIV